MTCADSPLIWEVIEGWKEASCAAMTDSWCLRSRFSSLRAWVSGTNSGPALPDSKVKAEELSGGVVVAVTSAVAVAAAGSDSR